MGNRKETRRMHLLRDRFFADGKRLSQSDDPAERTLSNCWICNLPIDYLADPGTTPESHNLDHYFSVSTHPELQEDPTNFRHAHALCNISRGNKTIEGGGLGEAVPQWWG